MALCSRVYINVFCLPHGNVDMSYYLLLVIYSLDQCAVHEFSAQYYWYYTVNYILKK